MLTEKISKFFKTVSKNSAWITHKSAIKLQNILEIEAIVKTNEDMNNSFLSMKLAKPFHMNQM